MRTQGIIMNDFAFILDRIEKAKEVVGLLEMILIENDCVYNHMENDSYEYCCQHPKSKPNKIKFPYDFVPRRDCKKCRYYKNKLRAKG